MFVLDRDRSASFTLTHGRRLLPAAVGIVLSLLSSGSALAQENPADPAPVPRSLADHQLRIEQQFLRVESSL